MSRKKSRRLREEITSCKKTARIWLTKGRPDAAMECLALTQDGSDIKSIKHKTKYDSLIALWALEHTRADLLDALAATLKPVDYLSIFNNKNYQCIRQFVKQSLQLSQEKYQLTSDHRREILKRLASVDSELMLAYVDPKIIHVIQEEINYAEVGHHSADTLSAFKADLAASSTSLVKSHDYSHLPLGASFFPAANKAEEASNSKKTVSFEMDSRFPGQNFTSSL